MLDRSTVKESAMNDATEKSPQTSSGSPPLLEVTEEQLRDVLQEHARWVASRGAEGRRANFRRTNLCGRALSGVDLRGADLEGADLAGAELQRAQFEALAMPLPGCADPAPEATHLQGANLQGANLEQANLRGANLQAANLREANLEAARLWDSNLRDADLQGAVGLFPAQLGGADTSHARLPKSLLPLGGQTNVLVASQTADRLFLSMLLGCAYGALTIASTTDAALLGNSTSSKLPIIGTEISVVPFYWVAPLLLVGLYIYFHVYLQDIWLDSAVVDGTTKVTPPLRKRSASQTSR
jgi:uncharacterized protein YjbI with pentapeptide repeats